MKTVTKNLPEIVFVGKGAFSGVRAALDVVAELKNYLMTERKTFMLVSLRGVTFGRPNAGAALPAAADADADWPPMQGAYIGSGMHVYSDGSVF